MTEEMDNTALQRTIQRCVETEDFEPLFDHLAEEVVVKVTNPEGGLISGELCGKQAVIDYFRNIGEVAPFRQEKCLEICGGDERIVVVGDDSFTIKKSGVTAHSHYALIFDLREGLISRFLIVQELTTNVGA